MAIKFSVARKNAALDTKLDQLNSGFLRVYSGTRPTNPDTALSGNTLLAELAYGATAFAAATGGTKTANAITSGTAVATGTATFARSFKSDGTTAIMDNDIGTSGSDLNLGSVAIQSGGVVSVSSFVVTEGG